MHLGFFDKKENSPGSLLSRLTNDASNLNNIILGIVGICIQTFFVFIIAVIVGFYFDWRISLIIMLFTPLLFLANYFYAEVVNTQNDSAEEFTIEAAEIQSECISNSKTVYGFNFQKTAVKQFKTVLATPMKNINITSLKYGCLFGISQTIRYFPIFISFYFGSVFIKDGSSTFGDITKSLLTFYIAMLYIGQSLKYVGDIAKANKSLLNVMKIRNEISELDPLDNSVPLRDNIDQIKGKIEFKNVTFKYPSRDEIILHDVSFIINPGQFSAFVGPSGSGKSTIIQLLERFYDLTDDNPDIEGEILIDDVNIKSYNINQLRSFISLVGQEPSLFKRSVKDNILYGKLDADEQEVNDAAAFSQISHLLDKQEDQFPISGGEKQRIAIARAVIRNPKIILLDEATSALDKNTETEIQKSLDEAMKGRTSIVVAHR